MPLPVILLMLASAALAWKLGYQRLARILALCLGLSLYFLSVDPVVDWIAEPLEFAHAPYRGQALEAVVVLGGAHRSDERKPVTSLLSATSMVRLSEGVRLYQQNPGARLCVSGYGSNDPLSQAEAMAKVAMAMGVPEQAIVIEPEPRDTREEAAVWSSRLQGKSVALVTSAMHMTRALFLFEQEGLRPLPAPTNFQTGQTRGYGWRSWIPKARNLAVVEAAWHEYLGLFWAHMMAFRSETV